MKRIAPLLVVLVLLGSVVWLTLRTSVDAPMPIEPSPASSADTTEESAPASIHAQPFVATESDREHSVRGVVVHAHGAVHVAMTLLDARMVPLGASTLLSVNDSAEFAATVPSRSAGGANGTTVGAVLLHAWDADGCECGRMITPRAEQQIVMALCAPEIIDRVCISDSDGRPMSGAQIRRGWMDPLLSTSAQGVVLVPRTTATLHVSTPGFAAARIEVGTTALAQELLLSLQRARPLLLRISDENGAPVAAARVRVAETGLVTGTDAQGTALLDSLPEDRSGLTIEISAGDLRHALLPLPTGASAQITLQLMLRTEGVVLDAQERARTGVRVRCFEAATGTLLAQTHTARDGRFILPATQTGSVIMVADDANALVHENAELPLRRPLQLLLPQSAPCSISTTNADGVALGGVRVRLLLADLMLAEATTDTAGKCTLPAANTCTLSATHALHLAATHPGAPANAITIQLALRPQVALAVTAEENNELIASITVMLAPPFGWVEDPSRDAALWPAPGRVFNSPTGHYFLRASAFDSGEPRILQVSAPGRSIARCAWTPQSGPIDVRLALVAPVVGRVLSRVGSAALEGIRINLVGDADASTLTDRNGAFTLSHVPIHPASLRVEGEGWETTELPLPECSSGSTRALDDIFLHGAGELSIVVSGLTMGDEATLILSRGDAPQRVHALSGSGPWAMRGLRVGRWSALLQSANPQFDQHRKVVDIAHNGVATLSFDQRATTATLMGSVLIPDGSAGVRGVVVRLRDAAGALIAQAACDRDGVFEIANVVPGHWTLEALLETAQGPLRGQMSIDLPAGETSVTLRLLR